MKRSKTKCIGPKLFDAKSSKLCEVFLALRIYLFFYVNLSEVLLFRVKLGTSSFPCNLSFNYSEIINFNWEAQCMRLKFIKVQN